MGKCGRKNKTTQKKTSCRQETILFSAYEQKQKQCEVTETLCVCVSVSRHVSFVQHSHLNSEFSIFGAISNAIQVNFPFPVSTAVN